MSVCFGITLMTRRVCLGAEMKPHDDGNYNQSLSYSSTLSQLSREFRLLPCLGVNLGWAWLFFMPPLATNLTSTPPINRHSCCYMYKQEQDKKKSPFYKVFSMDVKIISFLLFALSNLSIRSLWLALFFCLCGFR